MLTEKQTVVTSIAIIIALFALFIHSEQTERYDAIYTACVNEGKPLPECDTLATEQSTIFKTNGSGE